MNTTRAAFLLTAVVLGLCITQTAEAHHRKIVVQGFEADDNNMSLQLTLGGLTMSDDAKDESGVAQLGGMGLAWRWDLVHWGGIEVAAGGYGRTSENGLVQEDSSTFALNWMWYFARNHHHRFYGVTGLATVSTSGTIGEDAEYSYSEGGLNLGIGTEWLVSRRFMVSADLRTLLLSRNEDSEATPLLLDNPGQAREGWTTPPADRTAMQFNVGVGYRW